MDASMDSLYIITADLSIPSGFWCCMFRNGKIFKFYHAVNCMRPALILKSHHTENGTVVPRDLAVWPGFTLDILDCNKKYAFANHPPLYLFDLACRLVQTSIFLNPDKVIPRTPRISPVFTTAYNFFHTLVRISSIFPIELVAT